MFRVFTNNLNDLGSTPGQVLEFLKYKTFIYFVTYKPEFISMSFGLYNTGLIITMNSCLVSERLWFYPDSQLHHKIQCILTC